MTEFYIGNHAWTLAEWKTFIEEWIATYGEDATMKTSHDSNYLVITYKSQPSDKERLEKWVEDNFNEIAKMPVSICSMLNRLIDKRFATEITKSYLNIAEMVLGRKHDAKVEEIRALAMAYPVEFTTAVVKKLYGENA